MQMGVKTRRKLSQFEEGVAVACTTCRRVVIEVVETVLLLIGLYEFLRFYVTR